MKKTLTMALMATAVTASCLAAPIVPEAKVLHNFFKQPAQVDNVRIMTGVDFAVPAGTKIVAPEVALIGYGNDIPGFGTYVTITNKEGKVLIIANLERSLAQKPVAVKEGTVIGVVSKRTRQGKSYFHAEYFEDVKKNPNPSDPTPVLKAYGTKIKK